MQNRLLRRNTQIGTPNTIDHHIVVHVVSKGGRALSESGGRENMQMAKQSLPSSRRSTEERLNVNYRGCFRQPRPDAVATAEKAARARRFHPLDIKDRI